MQPETIQKLIQARLPDATVTITSHDHIHYQATVISEQFAGMSKLNQHRLVYSALKIQIHALQLTTRVPEEALA